MQSDSAKLISAVSELPEETLNLLSAYGAPIEASTTVQVISINNSNDAAVCVRNIDGDIIRSDVFIAYTQSECGDLVVNNSLAEYISAYENVVGGYSFGDSDVGFVVRGIAYERM